MDIDRMLEEGINERGNLSFRNEEGSAVLFAYVDDGVWLQAAFTPVNYPAWEVSTFSAVDEDLIEHIHENLDGWYVDKCNLDGVNIYDGRVENPEN